MCNYITVIYEIVNDYIGGYIWIFSHTYRYDWFLSQIALPALKYDTNVSGHRIGHVNCFISYLGLSKCFILFKINSFFQGIVRCQCFLS